MVDVENSIKITEKQLNIPEEERERFENMARALGNFMNALWECGEPKTKQ